MSFSLMAKVWSDDTIDDGICKFILLCLADYANNETRECYPSYTSIAKRTGFALRTVKSRIQMLSEKGYLKIKSGNSFKSNTYYLYPNDKEVVHEVHHVVHDMHHVVHEMHPNLSSNLDNSIREDWKPKKKTIEEIDRKHGKGILNHDNETYKFINYYLGTDPTKYKDWERGYHNWCAREAERSAKVTSINKFKASRTSNSNGSVNGLYAGLIAEFSNDKETET
tara:strand:- start:4089 stop:4760 length:672 start_codon:yes stop_codon:yes gene_type:complete